MKNTNSSKNFFKISAGILDAFLDAKEETKEKIKNKLSNSFDRLDFVKKNDLEEVKAIAVEARRQNDLLKKKLKALEKKLL